jgi:hypothetical protein
VDDWAGRLDVHVDRFERGGPRNYLIAVHAWLEAEGGAKRACLLIARFRDGGRALCGRGLDLSGGPSRVCGYRESAHYRYDGLREIHEAVYAVAFIVSEDECPGLESQAYRRFVRGRLGRLQCQT